MDESLGGRENEVEVLPERLEAHLLDPVELVSAAK